MERVKQYLSVKDAIKGSKRHASVADMMREAGSTDEELRQFREKLARHNTADQLAIMRLRADISTGEMAELLGEREQYVLDLEMAENKDITLGQIIAYAKATGSGLMIKVGHLSGTASRRSARMRNAGRVEVWSDLLPETNLTQALAA